MGKELVSDELWEVIEPRLPPEPPKPKGGRPRIDDRAALTGIIFVLKSGIRWEVLPKEMGCGSGSTRWRRLRDWEEAGVWRGLHRVLLDRLGEADEIDWSRASLDSASVAAKRGRGRRRVPDGSRQTGLEAPPCFGPKGRAARGSARGRPRKRPEKLHADEGCEFPRCRRVLRERAIKVRIARRGKETSEKLGRHR